MRIFLSYASEHKALAEQISESIKARGHRVFFDRDDLPAGDTYEDQIEKAIARSSLFIFLISPESVSDGRFTRTELLIARKKWASAKKRVLPVMIQPTPMEDVPNYLKTVTILEPEGSIPAETASAVQRIAQPWLRRLSKAAFLALAMGGGAVGWIYYQSLETVAWDVIALENTPAERALFGFAAADDIPFEITNNGMESALILAVDLNVEPDDALQLVSQAGALDYVGAPIAPSETFEGTFLVRPTGDQSTPISYTICALVEEGDELCSDPISYIAHPAKDYPFGNAFSFPDDFSTKIKHVEAADEETFLIATETQIMRLDPAKPDAMDATYEAERITALHVGAFGTVVAEAANPIDFRLVRLSGDLRAEQQLAVSFPSEITGTFGEPISERVTQISEDADNLWILTGGGQGAEGLAYIPSAFDRLNVPDYFDDVSLDLKGFRLRDGIDGVYTGAINVTPSDLVSLTSETYRELSGHDFEVVSCVSDAMDMDAGLLIHDCDGAVYAATWIEDRFGTGAQLFDLPGFLNDQVYWPEVTFFGANDERLFAGVSTLSNEAFGGDGTYTTVISRFEPSDGVEIIFQATDARILDIAATSDTAIAILENADGVRDTVTLDLSNGA